MIMNSKFDIDPQPLFQLIQQIAQLTSEKVLKSEDLQFILKHHNLSKYPADEYVQIFSKRVHPITKEIVPEVTIDTSTFSDNQFIHYIDLFIFPLVFKVKVLEEQFGFSQRGYYYPESFDFISSEAHIKSWLLNESNPVLMICSEEIKSQSIHLLRLVLRSEDNTSLDNRYWSDIYSHGRRLADELMTSVFSELSGFKEPEKAPVVSLAKEKARKEKELKEKRETQQREKQARELVNEILTQAFTHYNASHIHIFYDGEKASLLFRQNRTPCYQKTVSPKLSRDVIWWLKNIFNLDISVWNDYFMGIGEYELEVQGEQSIHLKAQVASGNMGEKIIIYQHFQTYSIQSTTLIWAERHDWITKNRNNLPLHLPIKQLTSEYYQQLCLWVEELSQAGVTVLISSKAKLTPPNAGHSFLDRATFYVDEDRLKRIIDVFHFDLHIEILSLDKPLDIIPKKLWGEYFCSNCYQVFVSYRKARKDIHCPICDRSDNPPIHSMYSFAFSYYLMSAEGRAEFDKAKTPWILDDGCEQYYYDVSPILEEAKQLPD